MGSVFKKFDLVLRQHGAKTYKIGFTAGDWYFSNQDNYIPFQGKKEEWHVYIKSFLETNNIEKIFLFGDCRFYQSQAIAAAYSLGIDIFVFEEGYVRPHYVTMEKYGVNDYSRISRNADFYVNLKEKPYKKPLHTKQSKFKMIYSATLYYLISNLFFFRYPHYEHHRDFSALKEAFYGVRGLMRKIIYIFTERKYTKILTKELSKRYFFVPLQTHNDFQILQHSEYGSIEKFIIEVLESFAAFAPRDDKLIFKHHPVDRGRRNYAAFIKEQAENLDISHRIIVFHDVHLPTCLKHAKGTVTINSTVGLTSLGYGIPTITLGNAIYDIKGLTNKKVSLNAFWKGSSSPDRLLYEKFIQYLIDKTQLNGSFYGLFPLEFEEKTMFIKEK
jgi:capsular polysaccharide export protein